MLLLFGQPFRDSEIGQLDESIGRKQDILEFDVPVDDVVFEMAVVHRQGDLG